MHVRTMPHMPLLQGCYAALGIGTDYETEWDSGAEEGYDGGCLFFQGAATHLQFYMNNNNN